MKYSLLILLAIPAFTACSQNTKPVRFQIGLNVSPDLCFRTIKQRDANPQDPKTINFMMDFRNKNEMFKLGQTSGIMFGAVIRDKWVIETGLQYANKGYQTKWVDGVVTTVDNPDGGDPVKLRARYNFYYLDMPLKAGLMYRSDKIRLIASAGCVVSTLLKATVTNIVVENDSRSAETRDNPSDNSFRYKTLNLFPVVSFGIVRKMNNRISVKIEQNFKYGILRTSDTPIVEYLWSTGFNAGCYFTL